ncbi:MAG: hypothetical protein MR796_03205, partial [Veillonella caviae]|nr:hypothetical protein [Veillonella caviae]
MSAKSTQEFTDTEYSRGWGFLGQEPPPYELFDDFFKKTDLKLKDLNDRQLAADSNLSKHNTSSSAHADIRTKITSDINAHNSSGSAHADIRTKITSDINAHNSSGSAHADIRAKITSDINAHNSSGSAHADIRAKITSDINAHNISNSAHADIRAKITSDINAHNSSGSAHADIRRMFNNYLPLTGGKVSGRTHIDSMLSVGQSSGVASNIRVDGAAGNAYIALLNYNNAGNLLIDGYFNNPETAAIDVTNRDKNGTVRYRSTLMDGKGNAKFANEVYANEKLLATKEYVDTHNTSSSAHNDIRQLFKWKKLYSINRAAFIMPASGTALCDIPSAWKELHITWIWRGDKSTINTVVGYEAYTINIVNEVTGDPIIFVAPGSEGY